MVLTFPASNRQTNVLYFEYALLKRTFDHLSRNTPLFSIEAYPVLRERKRRVGGSKPFSSVFFVYGDALHKSLSPRKKTKQSPQRRTTMSEMLTCEASHPSRSTPHSSRSVFSTAIDNQLLYIISGLRILYSIFARGTEQHYTGRAEKSRRWRDSRTRSEQGSRVGPTLRFHYNV